MHDQAVSDLGHRFDDRVEVARAEPHSPAIQRRVGPPGDDTSAISIEGDPVSVVPHAGEFLEVGAPVSRIVIVTPEADGHRRHRLGDHQLTGLARITAGAVRAERLNIASEHAGRDLSTAHGQRRSRPNETGTHVGTATERTDLHVATNRVRDPFEALGREWRAGRAKMTQPGEVKVVTRSQTFLATRHHKWSTHAIDVDVFIGCQLPKRRQIGSSGVTVEQHSGCADQRC